jgi:hypothetical protein
MAYIPVAEEYGAAYDAGLIDRDTAVDAILAAAGGGLTRLGAEDVLDNWRTGKARVADIGMTAAVGIAACRNMPRKEGW